MQSSTRAWKQHFHRNLSSCSDTMTLPTGSFLYKEGVIPPCFALHFLPLSWFIYTVSASDVRPTNRWLNVRCTRRTKWQSIDEFWSRYHRTGWIQQAFRGNAFFHVSHLMGHLHTELFWRQTLSWKFTTLTMIAYQDQLNAGFSELRDVHSTTFLNEWFVGCTVMYYCKDIDFFMPQMWCWTKRTMIGCIICPSDGLLSGSWPAKVKTINLKVWQRKTISKGAWLTGEILTSKKAFSLMCLGAPIVGVAIRTDSTSARSI